MKFNILLVTALIGQVLATPDINVDESRRDLEVRLYFAPSIPPGH